MKYALIGCGRIAINHVRAAIKNNLELVAFCDLDVSHIDSLIARAGVDIGVEKYTDYKKMILDHPEIELVGIATDSGVHAEIAIFCLGHGKNVIVEKPMAMSIGDADKMISIAKRNRLVLSVCHQNRFNTAIQLLKKEVDGGRFGKLSHGSIAIRWNRGKEYFEQASWRGKWNSDGGALMNQCIHGIDLLRWIMGDDVEEVFGTIAQRFHPYIECEDIGTAILKFKNGAVGTIEGTTNVFPNNLEETLHIFGENGTVKIGGTSCNNIDLWTFSDRHENDLQMNGLKEQTSNVYGNGHSLLYSDVITSIINKGVPLVDGFAGKRALEIVLAIYKSQLTGKSVRLPLKDFSTTEMNNYFSSDK